MGRVETNFKQTEIGLIPADWEVKDLSEIGRLKNGINKDEKDFGHGFPFVNLVDVFGESELSSQLKFGLVNSSVAERDLYNLAKGDVLFIRSSVKPSGVGLTSLVGDGLIDTVYSGFLIRFRDFDCLDLKFKAYCFNEESFRRRLIAVSTVSANTNINQHSLKKLKLAIPLNKTEQNAIANALSDADGYIESLEKLIAKKQLIKQGTMQQLFSPKPHWKPERFGDVVRVTKGQLITNETRVGGNIPVIAGGKSPAYYHNKPNRLGKSITISASGASAGYVSFHDYPIFASDCSTIEEDQNYSIEFIFFLLQLMQEKIYKMQTGGAQPHIHASDLNPIEIIIPSKKSEQLKIAKILSDMDTEINIIAKKLTKAKNLKQGMMQQLLTGKIRLV